MKKKIAVLLDVSAIMFRAFFGNRYLRTANEPTGAIYGFTNTLFKIIDEFEPDYMCSAFDVKRSTLKRREKYSGYKANRSAVPDELLTQIPRIEEILDCCNINRYKVDGYEADDVLGTLAKKFASHNIETYIITGDKDLAQLLAPNINIVLLKNDTQVILKTEMDVVEYIGVKSYEIPDLFGLIGDTSDGIPGISKMGPTKAIPIIEKYHTIENMYENIDKLSEIKGIGKGLLENIKKDKDMAFLCRDLARIETNLNIDVSVDNSSFHMDDKKLYKLFKELEFTSLIKKLKTKDVKESLPTPEKREFSIVDNNEIFSVMCEKLNKLPKIAVYGNEVGIAISGNVFDYYIPNQTGGLFGNNIDLNDFFKNYSGEIITYNLKKLLKENYKIKNCNLDIMIAYHLITSSTKEDIDTPINRYIAYPLQSYKTIFDRKKIDTLTNNEVGEFLCKRTTGLLNIENKIREILEYMELMNILVDEEMPLIPILDDMEKRGIKIDTEYFEKYKIEIKEILKNLENKIYEIAGEKFNINSPKQLGEILFFKLGYEPIKKTKTGFSTNEEVLTTLKDNGAEIATHLLEYRKYTKLLTTYVESILNLRDKNDRIHTTYHQIGTATGRLSSSDPNLQNIPSKTEEGIKIRAGFVASPGYELVGIDYSQIELRVLAVVSGDENLKEAYKNNLDLHTLTAQNIFEKKDITKDERGMAKTINFSVIYGKTPFGLSKELNITPKEASNYIDKYFAKYPMVKVLENKIIDFAEKNGYTETVFGRKRMIDGINASNKMMKAQAERMAVNSVIQGTAAEILKRVMIKLQDILNDDVHMLLQIHDELVFEIASDKLELYIQKIENIMRDTIKFDDVKLEINTGSGKNLAETK